MTFETAFTFIIQFEGGYVANPEDPGGETKYGISKKVYPDLDIASLTLDDAREIYKRDFWDRLGLDSDTFPDRIKLALFDSAINCGQMSAIKFLQSAVLESPDGVIGPRTLQRVEEAAQFNINGLLADIMWWRFRRVSQLKTFPEFGSGWIRRMMSVISNSV